MICQSALLAGIFKPVSIIFILVSCLFTFANAARFTACFFSNSVTLSPFLFFFEKRERFTLFGLLEVGRSTVAFEIQKVDEGVDTLGEVTLAGESALVKTRGFL